MSLGLGLNTPSRRLLVRRQIGDWLGGAPDAAALARLPSRSATEPRSLTPDWGVGKFVQEQGHARRNSRPQDVSLGGTGTYPISAAPSFPLSAGPRSVSEPAASPSPRGHLSGSVALPGAKSALRATRCGCRAPVMPPKGDSGARMDLCTPRPRPLDPESAA